MDIFSDLPPDLFQLIIIIIIILSLIVLMFLIYIINKYMNNICDCERRNRELYEEVIVQSLLRQRRQSTSSSVYGGTVYSTDIDSV